MALNQVIITPLNIYDMLYRTIKHKQRAADKNVRREKSFKKLVHTYKSTIV